MFKSTTLVLSLLATALAASACSPGAPAATASGPEVAAKAGGETAVATPADKNTYVIEQFGVTVTAPEGWFVMDSAFTKQLMDVGKDITTANMDTTTKAAMEASADKSANLFGFLKYPPGKPVASNPGVLSVAENVSTAPGLQRGSDYFFHMRKLLAQSAMDAQIDDTYKTVKIGGVDFDRMDMVVTVADISTHQRYFAARHGDYVVSFIQSYQDEAELADLDKIIESIKLNW